MTRQFVAVLFAIAIVAPVKAQEAPKDCAVAALTEYNRANLALLTQSPLMSIESTIAQRRLQEHYCLQFATCVVGSPDSSVKQLQYNAAFDSCLQDEALEKYDAVPRDK